MKLLRQFLVVAIITAGPSFADTGIEQDKISHFSVSAISTVTLIRLGQTVTPKNKITLTNRLLSSTLVAAAGLAKEIQDRNRARASKLDYADLRADGYGIIFGNIIFIQF